VTCTRRRNAAGASLLVNVRCRIVCDLPARGHRLIAFFYIPFGIGVLLRTFSKIVTRVFKHKFTQVAVQTPVLVSVDCVCPAMVCR
jgi:hypothetical protein